ncbi:MAG: hypothetical protein A2252_12570 [Elusimicrobia bacterium RIFOXYA2_FULL_39_19]|nr:MAG: hypothetical protein A2252_12570 [Elusimicrobia bacterium RIFOXYA2_FULL_39_19]
MKNRVIIFLLISIFSTNILFCQQPTNKSINNSAMAVFSESNSKPSLSSLENIIKNDSDDEARANAVGALGKLKIPESVEFLLETTNDPSPRVAIESIIALSEFCDNIQYKEKIISFLEIKETTRIGFRESLAIAYVFCKFGYNYNYNINWLSLFIENPVKMYVSRDSAYYLGKLGDVSVIDVLIKSIEKNEKTVNNASYSEEVFNALVDIVLNSDKNYKIVEKKMKQEKGIAKKYLKEVIEYADNIKIHGR